MKNLRDFHQRSQSDQSWITKNTWCDKCDAADLGQKDPLEYEENGKVFVEGKCNVCSSIVRSELVDKD